MDIDYSMMPGKTLEKINYKKSIAKYRILYTSYATTSCNRLF